MTKEIEKFTVGRDREMDLYLAKYDVLGSMAHITMLQSIDLLTADELKVLLKELKAIYQQAERGEFVIEEGVEDVHSQVEMLLTRKLGDIGKKIHSGRSRNDQVLVDLKLFIRDQIKEIAGLVKNLFDELIAQSERYKNVLMPGYTHLQVAMPSSFGLWFGAYAEGLVDDMQYLQAAWKTRWTITWCMRRWDVARRKGTWRSRWQASLAHWLNWRLMPACSTHRTSAS